jgi:hypothetical protein
MGAINALIDPGLADRADRQSWVSPHLDYSNMGSAYSAPLPQGKMQPPRVIDESARSPIPLLPFNDGANEPTNMLAPYNNDAWNSVAAQQRLKTEMANWYWLQLLNDFRRSRF